MRLENLRKELKEKYESVWKIVFVYIKPGLYMDDIIDQLDENELCQFNMIIDVIQKNYLKFGKYIKLNFKKDSVGEIYGAIFTTNDKKWNLSYEAVSLYLHKTGITDEVEFIKKALRECYIPLQNICDNIDRNKDMKIGDKITTYRNGNEERVYTLTDIHFHNHHKDAFHFICEDDSLEGVRYAFLYKRKDRNACQRLLEWVNMSDFFEEVLYTPLKKELKTRDERWNDHINWRYYEWFYRLVCSYLDLNNGSGIDNPFKLDLSIVKNKRGNVDVKISIISNEPNDKFGWYKFMAYRNIDINQPAVKEAIEKLGYNEGILEYCINGDPNDYQPEIIYPQWIWNKKYKTW